MRFLPDEANFEGSLVAVSFSGQGAGKTTPLAIYRFAGGQLSNPVTPAVPSWAGGEEVIDVEWHPRENTLALVNVNRPTLSFVRVAEANGGLRVAPYGQAVKLEKGPFLVRWTPDGRHVLCNSSYAGIDGVFDLPGAGLCGSVQSVRLASAKAPDGSPLHQIASRADTGPTPEGLSISPDGRWAVTTNLEQSTPALDSPNQGLFSSLTLLKLDATTGALERAGTYAFDGVLCEMAVFDNSSRFIASLGFTFFDATRKGGSLDFWRIAGDVNDPKRTELVKMDFRIPLTRGAHSLVIVR